MRIQIRDEADADARAIEQVTEQAFMHAAHTHHAEQFIVAALREAGELTVSLVAQVDATIVGHVAASPVRIAGEPCGWFGLGPVSVIPSWQGQGIGKTLIAQALERLRAQRAQGCVVLGEPAYYSRFGFHCDPRLVLAGVAPEYFQALAFTPSVPSGRVTYHCAFDSAT